MRNEQNELIPTAGEGEEPEPMAVGTQSDHRQRSTTLDEAVSFSLFITLSKA